MALWEDVRRSALEWSQIPEHKLVKERTSILFESLRIRAKQFRHRLTQINTDKSGPMELARPRAVPLSESVKICVHLWLNYFSPRFDTSLLGHDLPLLV